MKIIYDTVGVAHYRNKMNIISFDAYGIGKYSLNLSINVESLQDS